VKGAAVNNRLETEVTRQLQRPRNDRRQASFSRLFVGAIVHGRRRGPRRLSDADACYVDRYDQYLFLAATGIFLFCCLDALLTLTLLEMGAQEANPLMAALIDYGVGPFFYTKLVITGAGIVFLVIHSTFLIGGIVRVSQALYAILMCYAALFVYQLGMLAQVI
jgi:hypothetical protein